MFVSSGSSGRDSLCEVRFFTLEAADSLVLKQFVRKHASGGGRVRVIGVLFLDGIQVLELQCDDEVQRGLVQLIESGGSGGHVE